jgi:RecA-family ATPase
MRSFDEVVDDDAKMQERLRRAEEAHGRNSKTANGRADENAGSQADPPPNGSGAKGQAPPEPEDQPGPKQDKRKSRRLQFANFADMDFKGALLNLIKGLIGHRQTVVLFGDSGTGKSLIALAMAMCVALGRSFCGRQVRQAFVAYLSPEGANSIALRAHAWAKRHGIDLRDTRIRGLPHAIDLCHDDTDLDEIIEGIRELEQELGKCELVIVDTVSRALAGGDENHPKDMGAFVRRCDMLRERVGTTVMAVHHTAVGGDEPRGHRSLRNAADVRLYVTKLADGLSQLEVKHAKDGANGDQLVFRIVTEEVGTDEDGEPIVGAVAVHEQAAPAGEPGRPPKQKLTERQERVLQELQKQAREQRKWEFTFAEFTEACRAAGVLAEVTNDSTRRNIAHALRHQLANRKVITVDGKAEKVRLAG